MAGRKNDNVLTSEFLAELYNCAITNNQICSVVSRYMEDTFLPDQQYQMLNSALKSYFAEYKTAPGYGLISQRLSTSRAVSELLEEIKEVASNTNTESIRDQFEEYLKLVRFKQIMRDVNKLNEDGARLNAMKSFVKEATQLQQFSLKPDELLDVAKTYEERLTKNKMQKEDDGRKPVTSFFIDPIDAINQSRSLRTQLTMILAMPGTGKSHAIRHIGFNAAYIAGLDVLHIQLEGSVAECADAYSAMLTGISTYDFERGIVNSHALDSLREKLKTYAGSLKIKSNSRFGKEYTTGDLMTECEKYKERFFKYPDVVLVDSADLMGDSSGKSYDNKSLRFKRLAVFQELKDIATITGCWLVASYQATIESQDFVENEKKHLGMYNVSEGKGISRPCTHVISLNQSSKERNEGILRINIDKFRFAPKCDPFKIAIDFDRECFFDRERSLNLIQE